MFLSHEDLKLQFGVDLEIGKFLVDRRVPPDNAYWRKRLLYLNFQPGYIFIPLFADLQFRLGIPKKELMSDDYMNFAEAILNSAGKQEWENLSHADHIKECLALTQPVNKNPSLLRDLTYYFNGEKEKASIQLGTPFPALQRGDAYLFTLCYFPFDQELKQQLVEAWYALICFYLITDDLEDMKIDFKKNEENSILEAGVEADGIAKIITMLQWSHDVMSKINPVLANRIDFYLKTTNIQSIVDSFLKEKSKV